MPISSIEGICNMALGYAGVNKRINSIDDPSASAQACKTYFEQYRDKVLFKYEWPWATRRVALAVFSGAAWDGVNTTYNAGDIVQYGPAIFRSLQAGNLGNQPNVSPAWWFQVTRDGWAFVAPPPADYLRILDVYEKPVLSPTGTPLSWQFQPPPPLRAMRSDQRPSFVLEDANDGSGTQVILTDLDQPVARYTARITNPQSFSQPFIDVLAWALAPVLCAQITADINRVKALKLEATGEIRESLADEMKSIRQDPEPVSEFEAARES